MRKVRTINAADLEWVAVNGATVEHHEDGSVSCTLPPVKDSSTWGRATPAVAPKLRVK